jgi:hypothetical protein
VYELLFRSRWYSLVWALIMTASAVTFTTTGVGGWLTGTNLDAQASREARESRFRSWAEDDKRTATDDQGFDPSSPERIRDGLPPRDETPGAERYSVTDETDESPADGKARQ